MNKQGGVLVGLIMGWATSLIALLLLVNTSITRQPPSASSTAQVPVNAIGPTITVTMPAGIDCKPNGFHAIRCERVE